MTFSPPKNVSIFYFFRIFQEMNGTNELKVLLLWSFFLLHPSVYGQLYIEVLKDSVVNAEEVERWITIDSMLQVQFRDTIEVVKSQMKGLWHYQGNREGTQLIADTLYWTGGSTFFVRDGAIFQLKEGVETPTDEIDVCWFDFSPYEMCAVHSRVNKNHKGFVFENRTCQPFYNIAYYKGRLGLSTIGRFYPIHYLKDPILVIEVQKEFDFKYINNQHSTVKLRKEFEYFVRME
jgi:hypothetical protein